MMRFTVESDAFRKAVSVASLPVRRAYIPILDCVRIKAGDNALILTGTDMDTTVIAKCEAAVSDPGEACVNAADLKAIIARMKGPISVSGDLTLESGSAKLTLPTLTDAFPDAAKPKDEKEIVGGVETFIACVQFASTEEVKWHIGGVIFDTDTAVATNGVSFYATPCEGGAGQIVPHQAKPVFDKIGGRLFLGDGTWRVESEGCQAIGKLVDAPPVGWRRINFDRKPFSRVSADALTEAVEAVTVGRAAWVCLAPSGESYIVSGDRFTGSHIEGSFTVPTEGFPQGFVCETKNLLKVLAAYGGQNIALSTDGGVLKISTDRAFSLLMPMRDARTQLVAA